MFLRKRKAGSAASLLVAGVFACVSFVVTAAQAGECPADQTRPTSASPWTSSRWA